MYQKVILTSATHGVTSASEIIEARFHITEQSLDIHEPISNEMFAYQIEYGCLSPSNLMGNVCVFLPDPETCKFVRDKMSEQGVKATVLTEFSDDGDVRMVKEFLNSTVGSQRVLLTTNVLETGITLNLDVVIDFMHKTVISYDGEGEPRMLVKNIVPISEGEATQRRGRVGRLRMGTYRYLPGVAVAAKTVVTIEKPLLFALFGYKLPDNMFRALEPFVGKLTRAKCALMLSSGLHPLILRPYFDDDGYLLGNCADTLNTMFPITGIEKGTELLDYIDHDDWFDISVRTKSGSVKMQVPYPVDGYDSIVNVAIGYNITTTGGYVNTMDTYQENRFVAPEIASNFSLPMLDYDSGSTFTGNSSFLSKSDMVARPKLDDFKKKRSSTYTYMNDPSLDTRIMSPQPTSERFRGRKSSVDTFDEDKDKQFMTVDAFADEMAKFRNSLQASLRDLVAPTPVNNESPVKKGKSRGSWVREYKPLKVKELPMSMLVMPLGCETMSNIVTEDCKRFINKLISGKFDSSNVELPDMKKYCVFICQYFNDIVSKQMTWSANLRSMENMGKHRGIWSYFNGYRSLRNRYKLATSTVSCLRELILVWERAGLYLVKLEYGAETIWKEESEGIFQSGDMNSFHFDKGYNRLGDISIPMKSMRDMQRYHETVVKTAF